MRKLSEHLTGHASQTSNGKLSGSLKKVIFFPVLASVRTGSVAIFMLLSRSIAESKFSTVNAR